jgi:hypothetical protein
MEGQRVGLDLDAHEVARLSRRAAARREARGLEDPALVLGDEAGDAGDDADRSGQEARKACAEARFVHEMRAVACAIRREALSISARSSS